MTSDRMKLLQPLPAKVERVELPEFGEGEYVMIHSLNARDHNRFQAALLRKDFSGLDRKRALEQKERLLIWCIRDDDGNRIFTEEHVDAIGEWPASVVNRLHDVAQRLCGATDTSTETSEKNSPEIPAA